MSKLPENRSKAKQQSGFKLSLDTWAVVLALTLSVLVLAGLIKQIPW